MQKDRGTDAVAAAMAETYTSPTPRSTVRKKGIFRRRDDDDDDSDYYTSSESEYSDVALHDNNHRHYYSDDGVERSPSPPRGHRRRRHRRARARRKQRPGLARRGGQERNARRRRKNFGFDDVEAMPPRPYDEYDDEYPDEEPDPEYAKPTSQQIWHMVLLSLMVFIVIGGAAVSVAFNFAGKRNNNDVIDNVDTRQEAIQEAKRISEECFKCKSGEQQADGTFVQNGRKTTFITSAMRLTKEAARNIHFAGGIEMPGAIFGTQVSGFSPKPHPPVIFTRGYLSFLVAGASHLQGNRGYTSMAYLTNAQSTPESRCKTLVDPSGTIGDIVVPAPHYILQDVSATGSDPDFYYCVCFLNVDSNLSDPSLSEYCQPFDNTLT